MEETVRIRAIVLDRKPYREHDLLVTVYSQERGREQLIARGARKFRSKVAAHVEPFCSIEGLLIVGKSKNYLGSALSSNVFIGIKSDLEKLATVSKARQYFMANTYDRVPELDLYKLLEEYLVALNGAVAGFELLTSAFKLKMLAQLGLGVDLEHCGKCGQDLKPGCNKFNQATSRIVGLECATAFDLTISDKCVRLLRLLSNQSFLEINKFSQNVLTLEPILVEEVIHICANLADQTQV